MRLNQWSRLYYAEITFIITFFTLVHYWILIKLLLSGYGHIAPKTAIAKVVTIFYAILGIPLTVLCWSNIGDAMANAFRFCYWRICCYICTKKPKKKKKRQLSRSRGWVITVRLLRGSNPHGSEIFLKKSVSKCLICMIFSYQTL